MAAHEVMRIHNRAKCYTQATHGFGGSRRDSRSSFVYIHYLYIAKAYSHHAPQCIFTHHTTISYMRYRLTISTIVGFCVPLNVVTYAHWNDFCVYLLKLSNSIYIQLDHFTWKHTNPIELLCTAVQERIYF